MRRAKAGSGVQEEKMKSKEVVTEMSQDAGYRTREGADVWELKKKNLCRKSDYRFGVKINFSLRDLKVYKEKCKYD